MELCRLTCHCERALICKTLSVIAWYGVCGIRNNAICKWLLVEENLDLKKAEQFAMAMEIAARDTSQLSPSSKAHESTATGRGGSSNENETETGSNCKGHVKIARTSHRRRLLPVWEGWTLATSMPLSRIRLSQMRKNWPHSRGLQGNEENNKHDESAQNNTTSRCWINWTLSTRPAQCPLTG